MSLTVDEVVNDLPAGALILTSRSVPGGTLYETFVRGGEQGQVQSSSMQFVDNAVSTPFRYLSLTNAKADTGVGLTATATGGALGVARTAGTSLTLVGEATSGNAKTDKGLWEFDLSSGYVDGSDITIEVNSAITGSGTLTAASCTMTAAFYTETNGVEAAVTTSAAVQMTAAGATQTFTVTGTNLVHGQPCALELAMLVTSSSGANTGQINSVKING